MVSASRIVSVPGMAVAGCWTRLALTTISSITPSPASVADWAAAHPGLAAAAAARTMYTRRRGRSVAELIGIPLAVWLDANANTSYYAITCQLRLVRISRTGDATKGQPGCW